MKSDAGLLKIYGVMLETRIIDLMIQGAFCKQWLRRRYLFSAMGQEAAGAVCGSVLKPEDYLLSQYRGYAYLLGKGASPEKLIGNLLTKRSGAGYGIIDDYCFIDEESGIPGYSKLLGTNFSLAVGLALAAKRRGDGRIVLCSFGDGESSRNTFAGALNLSKLWKLPIVWICENNRLSISTPLEKMSATRTIAERAKGFGIASKTVPGLDAVDLYAAVQEVVEEVRNGSTPYLLEIEVRREVDHSLADMYASDSPMEFPPKLPRGRDPLAVTADHLVRLGVAAETLLRMRDEKSSLLETVFRKALHEEPVSEEMFWEIYQP